MLISLGADAKKVRAINRSVILNLIRQEGPITKAKITRTTGISFSTVNRVVEDLLEEDLIQPVKDMVESSGGRPGELVEFNGKSHYVIGIDLGFPNIRGMIADLSGQVHQEIATPIERGNGNENYQRLISTVNQLKSEIQDRSFLISGIGLGVAGNVDPVNGEVLYSPIMGWENFPLSRRLQQDTGLTLFLDNDINLITLGEYGFGIGQGAANMACISLGTRVLCGLIINGELYRGANFNSGRIDHFLPGSGLSLSNGSGALPLLEALISSPTILEKGRAALRPADPQGAEQLVDAKAVYQAARNGETWAVEIIDGVVPALAVAVGNIASLLDLELIVFSGRMSEEADVLLPRLTSYLNGKIPRVPHIRASTLGTRSTVLGSVMLVYKGILHNR